MGCNFITWQPFRMSRFSWGMVLESSRLYLKKATIVVDIHAIWYEHMHIYLNERKWKKEKGATKSGEEGHRMELIIYDKILEWPRGNL